jgi:hypothetical protein
MPWEIDYTLLTFTQLKKSKYYLDEDVNITIDSVLNLSSYLINWEESKLPKEYFIEKYNTLSILLEDYNHNKLIYDGNELYGHLDLQREAVNPNTDYYISICPDIYFDETLLGYMVESIKNINDKYFVLTPQITKMWDQTWDVLTNQKYQNIPYEEWDKVDIFNIINDSTNLETPYLTKLLHNYKWAGWFDVYSKDFYEKLTYIEKDWNGYGAWDYFGMNVIHFFKQMGGDFNQYVLNNKLIFEYCVGPLKQEQNNINGFSNYYKNQLSIIPTHKRNDFMIDFNQKLINRIQTLKNTI